MNLCLRAPALMQICTTTKTRYQHRGNSGIGMTRRPNAGSLLLRSNLWLRLGGDRPRYHRWGPRPGAALAADHHGMVFP